MSTDARDPGMDAVLDRFRIAGGGDTVTARVNQVESALRFLARGDTYLHLIICELMWEVLEGDYWKRARDEQGQPYKDVSEYLRHVLNRESLKRSSIYQRLRVGKAMRKIELGYRDWVRDALAHLGMSKALALAPVLGLVRGQESILSWISKAKAVTAVELRRIVAVETEAKARGRERGPLCPHCLRPMPIKKVTEPV